MILGSLLQLLLCHIVTTSSTSTTSTSSTTTADPKVWPCDNCADCRAVTEYAGDQNVVQGCPKCAYGCTNTDYPCKKGTGWKAGFPDFMPLIPFHQ